MLRLKYGEKENGDVLKIGEKKEKLEVRQQQRYGMKKDKIK